MQSHEVRAIRVTRNPTDSCWQLPLKSLAGWPVCLVGWVLKDAPIDAGVPAEVAAILLRGLLTHWRITFFDEEFAVDTPSTFPLRPAADLETALRLFETVRFAWDQMNQAAFLSPLDHPSPRIRNDQVRRVLDRTLFDPAQIQSESGVTGLLLPAVDGDFAAFSFFDESMPVFLSALEQECVTSGVGFEALSEHQFKNAAWYASPLAPGAAK
jgi:hypothetical protein